MNNLDLGTKRLNFDFGLVLPWIIQTSFISDCTLGISVDGKVCSFIAISVMCIHEVIQMGVVVFAKVSMNTKKKF